jgi:NitT/TauT family transport system ATP-binding protein
MVSIYNLKKTYPNAETPLTVLENFSLDVEAGSVVSLIGPSGCGKTTLLYILAGILPFDAGHIEWESSSSSHEPSKKQTMGLILQNYGLFPWKTVWRNILLGMDIRGINKMEKKKRAVEVLDEMGLLPFKDYYPHQLSGGQKQRVALARAFALQPSILLMDEPFSALDALTREELQESFLGIWQRYSITTLLVTHSVEEALYLSHRIAIISALPGRVIEILDNPFFGQRMDRYEKEYVELMARIRKGLNREGF